MIEDKTFEPTLKLVFQGSVNIKHHIEGSLEYQNLKHFLEAIDPKFTLNGQVIMPLEPCCKDKKP